MNEKFLSEDELQRVIDEAEKEPLLPSGDIYGGALNKTIYDTGRVGPAPEFFVEMEAEPSPQVDEREARRAELMAEMEAAREQGRDSQEMER